MVTKKFIFILAFRSAFRMVIKFVLLSMAEADTCTLLLPPYNIMWPLWSPARSTVHSITGLPTPFAGSFNSLTVLAVQPVIAWDPAIRYPYLLFIHQEAPPIMIPIYGIGFGHLII
jgi:hypothetical protein